MPQMIETKLSATKKDISSQVQKELEVLKEHLDGTEHWVQDRFPVPSHTVNDDLKAQLANMRSQIANSVKKPVQPPPPALPESLMQMLNQAPPIQSHDDIWGEELPTKIQKAEE